MKRFSHLFIVTSAALVLAACGNTQTEDSGSMSENEQTESTESSDSNTETSENMEQSSGESSESSEAETTSASMVNSDSEEVGTAVFEENANGVTIDLNLEEIPAGEYGMHIHEVGSATPPTFEDAGDHFNPTDVEHGTNSETGPHVGDMPNLEVPENGMVGEMVELPNTSLQADGENTLNSEEGTSLIIHTEPDDYESQPSGDAGDRMIGGVIFSGNE